MLRVRRGAGPIAGSAEPFNGDRLDALVPEDTSPLQNDHLCRCVAEARVDLGEWSRNEGIEAAERVIARHVGGAHADAFPITLGAASSSRQSGVLLGRIATSTLVFSRYGAALSRPVPRGRVPWQRHASSLTGVAGNWTRCELGPVVHDAPVEARAGFEPIAEIE